MKRANGEGSIHQNPNGTWTAQIRTPHGRPSKTFTSQRKARSWLTATRRDLDTGDYVEPSGMTLGTWWDKWVAVYKTKSVGNATLQSYRYSRARLPESLLTAVIGDITPTDVQEALNGLAGHRRTIEITRTALKMCFDRAVTDGMIRKNPTVGAQLPKDDTIHKAKALTDDDDKALIKRLTAPCRMNRDGTVDQTDQQSQTIRDALYFVRMTGVRRAECTGLTWDDITDRIHIAGTKNKFSDRFVPMLPEIKNMIDRRRFTRNGEFVFATATGKRLDGSNLLRWMSSNTDYTVHDLRHQYISKAAQAGINAKLLMMLTGHARVETLLDVYTHFTDADLLEAATKISARG